MPPSAQLSESVCPCLRFPRTEPPRPKFPGHPPGILDAKLIAMTASTQKKNLAFFWSAMAAVAFLEWSGAKVFVQMGAVESPTGVLLGGSARCISNGILRGVECCAVLLLVRWFRPQLHPPPTARTCHLSIVFGVTITLAAGLLVGVLGQSLGRWGFTGFGLRALAVGSFVIVAPWMEEILFRGILYAMLRAQAGIAVATLLSALLFAAAHAGALGLGALIPVFVGAVVMALIYERSGRLEVCIVLHGIYNACVFLRGVT